MKGFHQIGNSFDLTVDDSGYRPSSEAPLVYYLFGHHDIKESLVVTEDDYVDFLIAVTTRKDSDPTVCKKATVRFLAPLCGQRLDFTGLSLSLRLDSR